MLLRVSREIDNGVRIGVHVGFDLQDLLGQVADGLGGTTGYHPAGF